MSLVVQDAKVTRGAFTLDASFEAPFDSSGGGITAVFGPSGAGKTMLLSTIAGLNRLEAGAVSLDGADVSRVPAHRREVGVVFQEARLFPHLSVRGNLDYALKRTPEDRRRGIEEAAKRCDIEGLLDRAVRNLSGGEKSRVALARALVAAPKLLLLDEPFAALDGRRRRSFLAMLRQVSDAAHLPMLVVTHQIEDAAELADNLVVMKEGRVVAQGEATKAMRDPAFIALLDPRDVGVRLHPGAVSSFIAGDARGLWMRADSVLVASEEPRGLSARNVWEGAIAAIDQEADGSMLVALDTRAGFILARITPEACAELALSVGQKAWAVVKSHSL